MIQLFFVFHSFILFCGFLFYAFVCLLFLNCSQSIINYCKMDFFRLYCDRIDGLWSETLSIAIRILRLERGLGHGWVAELNIWFQPCELNVICYCLLYSGAATIPMGAGGTLLGGYLVKKLNLTCAGIIKFCFVCSFCAFCCIFCFLIKCPDTNMAGVNIPFTNLRSVLVSQSISPIYFLSLPLRGFLWLSFQVFLLFFLFFFAGARG